METNPTIRFGTDLDENGNFIKSTDQAGELTASTTDGRQEADNVGKVNSQVVLPEENQSSEIPAIESKDDEDFRLFQSARVKIDKLSDMTNENLRDHHDDPELRLTPEEINAFKKALHHLRPFALSALTKLCDNDMFMNELTIGYTIAQENTDLLESNISKDNQIDTTLSLALLKKVDNLLSSDHISQHTEVICHFLKDEATLVEYVPIILKNGRPEEREMVINTLEEIFLNDGDLGKSSIYFELSTNPLPEINQIGQQYVDRMADRLTENLGLDMKPFLEAWQVSTKAELLTDAIRANIRTIINLETSLPGSVTYLSQEYGIMDLSRYPEEILKEQFENRDTDQPYGVIIYPRNDYNGVFYQHTEAMSHLRETLPPGMGIRILECDNKLDLVRGLIKLDNKFGEKNKIAFAVIGGHGSKDSIQFGGNDDDHKLFSKDFQGRRGRRAGQTGSFFEPGCSFVLVSCSTGAKGGIGEEMNNTLNVNLIASDIPSNINNLTARTTDGKTIIDADYVDYGAKQVYTARQ